MFKDYRQTQLWLTPIRRVGEQPCFFELAFLMRGLGTTYCATDFESVMLAVLQHRCASQLQTSAARYSCVGASIGDTFSQH